MWSVQGVAHNEHSAATGGTEEMVKLVNRSYALRGNEVDCRTIEQMRLANALCRFVELAE